MKKLFCLSVSLLLVLICAGTVSAWETISAEDANLLLQNENTYLLDVRTPCEWKFVGHPIVQNEDGNVLEGKVINIPFWLWEYDRRTDSYIFSGNVNKFFDAAVANRFDPGDTIILMCKTGGRAGLAGNELEDPTQPASNRLEELGFYSLYNLQGGFEALGGWKDSGLPYSNADAGIWKPSDQQGRSLDK